MTIIKYSFLYVIIFTLFHVTNPTAIAATTSDIEKQKEYLRELIAELQQRLAAQTQTTSTLNLTRNLYLGVKGDDVIRLQNFLRSTGDYTYPEVTGYYGNATAEAVKKYQCRTLKLCSGSAEATGYGVVGPQTRSSLTAATSQSTKSSSTSASSKKNTSSRTSTTKKSDDSSNTTSSTPSTGVSGTGTERSVTTGGSTSVSVATTTPGTTSGPQGTTPPLRITSISMPEYWPTSLKNGETLIKHKSTDRYGAPFEGLRSRYIGRGGRNFEKQDFVYSSPGVYDYIDTWYLKVENGTLLEYRDDVMNNGQLIVAIYEQGKEIDWGSVYTLTGSKKINQDNFIVDSTKSSANYTTNPVNRYGYAYFQLERIEPSMKIGGQEYYNVAVVYHAQSICIDASCTGASYDSSGKQNGGAMQWQVRYWLAPGKGIVQTEYISNSLNQVDTEAGRIDYVSKMCYGTEADYYCR